MGNAQNSAIPTFAEQGLFLGDLHLQHLLPSRTEHCAPSLERAPGNSHE